MRKNQNGGRNTGQLWYCTRQRAGPLIKECRSLRPPLGPSGTRQDAADKRQIRKGPHSAVTRTQVDRLELRLAMFGYEGSHYTLTYDWEHLPKDWDAVRRYFRAFRARAQRWRKGADYDWAGCIEGRHGDHRYHIHLVLRDSQFSPAEVRYLWRGGEVDDEPVLRGSTRGAATVRSLRAFRLRWSGTMRATSSRSRTTCSGHAGGKR